MGSILRKNEEASTMNVSSGQKCDEETNHVPYNEPEAKLPNEGDMDGNAMGGASGEETSFWISNICGTTGSILRKNEAANVSSGQKYNEGSNHVRSYTEPEVKLPNEEGMDDNAVGGAAEEALFRFDEELMETVLDNKPYEERNSIRLDDDAEDLLEKIYGAIWRVEENSVLEEEENNEYPVGRVLFKNWPRHEESLLEGANGILAENTFWPGEEDSTLAKEEVDENAVAKVEVKDWPRDGGSILDEILAEKPLIYQSLGLKYDKSVEDLTDQLLKAVWYLDRPDVGNKEQASQKENMKQLDEKDTKSDHETAVSTNDEASSSRSHNSEVHINQNDEDEGKGDADDERHVNQEDFLPVWFDDRCDFCGGFCNQDPYLFYPDCDPDASYDSDPDSTPHAAVDRIVRGL